MTEWRKRICKERTWTLLTSCSLGRHLATRATSLRSCRIEKLQIALSQDTSPPCALVNVCFNGCHEKVAVADGSTRCCAPPYVYKRGRSYTHTHSFNRVTTYRGADIIQTVCCILAEPGSLQLPLACLPVHDDLNGNTLQLFPGA